MPKYSLLVGSEAFASAFEADVGAATRRVLVQAMTFEGDASGRRIAGALGAGRADDRRVLVDSYTRHVVSDAFVWSPRRLLDRGFADEVRTTDAMFKSLAATGVGVRVTNPPGPLFLGLSIFDFVSYHAQEELVAIVSDPQVIADFRSRVIEPSLAEATRASPGVIPARRASRARRALKGAEWFVVKTREGNRRADPW